VERLQQWTQLQAALHNLVSFSATRNTFCRTRLSNATFFHFWSRDVHPVQNLLLCTKFHENPMIFHSDMAIYRLSKWQLSAILELFYHHTRPPTKSLLLRSDWHEIWQAAEPGWLQLPVKFHVNLIHRSEDIAYSYLNFSHIWLEMPIQAKNGGFGGLWTHKCDYSSSRPPKGISLRKSASFKQSTVKIKSASLNDRPTVDILFNIRKINVNNCDQSLYWSLLSSTMVTLC